MTNLPAKPQAVQLGGKVRTFAYDFNAHIEFNTATGSDLIETVTSMAPRANPADPENPFPPESPPSIAVLRALVWAGLLHQDESLTLREVGSWLSINTFGQLGPLIGAAISEYMRGVPADRPTEAPAKSRSRSTGAALNSSAQ